jgi:aldose 1-epimerase
MYELSLSDFGAAKRYTLRHPDNPNSFSVVPGAGATVLDIHLNGINVIDGCESPEELANNAGGKTSVLFPFPNRLDGGRYEWEGQLHEFPINDPGTGNAIHGFVRDAAFQVDNVVLARNYASITCSYHYSGQLPYYPFPFQLNVVYSIFEHGVFRLAAECINLHFYDIPVGFGWHPYFRLAARADEHSLKLPPCERMEIDERMLPTGGHTPYSDFAEARPLGDTRLDTAFRVDPALKQYELQLSAGNRRLTMRADRAHFPYFMVFTPDDRGAVAFEPMSCNMNAFNNREDLTVLPPDGVWAGMVELQMSV